MKRSTLYIILGAIAFLGYNITAAMLANNGKKSGTIMFFTEIGLIVFITIAVIINSIIKKKKS